MTTPPGEYEKIEVDGTISVESIESIKGIKRNSTDVPIVILWVDTSVLMYNLIDTRV